MEKENKERLVKIIAAAVLLAVAVVVEKTTDLKMWQYLLIFLVPYLIVGGETLLEAGETHTRRTSGRGFPDECGDPRGPMHRLPARC